MIAALYVDPNGPYAGRGDIDCWDKARNAHNYAGPWLCQTLKSRKEQS